MEGVGFKSFADLFRERVFVNLVCYADESGTHDETGRQLGADVALVAGCFALQEEWAKFDAPWRTVLDEYGVPDGFHMSDFVAARHNQSKPSIYSGWSDEKRDGFVRKLAAVIGSLPIHKIGCGVHVQEYDQAFHAEVKKFFRHPWYFCFWMLLSRFTDKTDARMPGGLWPDEQIVFFFDRQKEFSRHAVDTFERFRTALDSDHLLGAISFVGKDRHIPLQAADLVAYQMRRLESGAKKAGTPFAHIDPGGLDDLLIADSRTVIAHYDAESMQRIEPRLRKGIEQLGWR